MKHSREAKYDPWSDQDCIDAFVNKWEQEFNEYCAEFGLSPNNDPEPAFNFCELNESQFLDFAHNFEKDLEDAEGERRWEQSGDR